MIRVEEKLFQNRYRVDAGRPHIQIGNPDLCTLHCETKPCTVCCPAACYTRGRRRARDAHHRRLPGVRYLPRDLHRASQRAVGYPRGGYGVLFKFG